MLQVSARPLVLRGRRFLLKVEDSASVADYPKFESLRSAVWGFPEDHLAGPRNMACENFLHDGSSFFLAAYAEDAAGRLTEDAAHLVGFSYGYVGLKDKAIGYRSPENLWFYSQYTAVHPDYRGYGLGTPLKEFQRDVVMGALGIFTVVCTFDPLTAVNAYRNIHRFGMDVVEYRASTYGEFGGLLNRTDVPTDRFFMNWDLRRAMRHAALRLDDLLTSGAGLVEVGNRTIRGRSGPVELEEIQATRPDGGREVVLVRIPRDFYAMLRETDVKDPEVRRIPVEWRTRTRTVFQDLLAGGYRVVDFDLAGRPRPSPFYILRRDR